MTGNVYSVAGIPCLYAYNYKSGKKRYFVRTQFQKRILTQNLDVKSGMSRIQLRRLAIKTVDQLKNNMKNPKSMKQWIEEYILIHQLTKKTANQYRKILSTYSFDYDKNTLELAQTLTQGINSPQIARTVRAFFNWLIQNGVAVINPAANIKIPKVNPRRRTLSKSEIHKFYEALSHESLELNLYGRLLLETGARVSTIYQIRLSNLNEHGLQLRNFKCKRDYALVIPLSEETRGIWGEYMNEAKPKLQLFVSNFYVLNAHLRKVLNANFNQNPSQERFVIHSLRHTAATIALQQGVPLEIVSKMLDHASINTTYSIYAKPSQNQLNQAFSKLHDALLES